MIRSIKFIILFTICVWSCKNETPNRVSFLTVFEKSNEQETATYSETIEFYEKLAQSFTEISIQTVGETDAGFPLHVVTYNPNGSEDNFDKLRIDNRIIMINNGIHPGESDGIDATMLLFRDLVFGDIAAPKKTIISTIPIYNVGGSLNRNSTSRTNQNGPKEYGFRGNARNYDLNRDFIKSDSKNAKSFAQIYHMIKPDVFIDTHVSNGADYQYTLTHLFTQHNKLGGAMGNLLHKTIMPNLEQKLSNKSWDITPYVNVFNKKPEQGFSQFFDAPRYSTGYTTLFNTLGMMVETHMLKPYGKRVKGTYELLISMIEIVEELGQEIREAKSQNTQQWKTGALYPIQWELDTTKSTTLQFKGYEGEIVKSAITGGDRLKFNNKKPFVKAVDYKNYFRPSKKVKIPRAYIIPKGWFNVIACLKLNKIELRELERDTTFSVESYRIVNYATRNNPYEGHYSHYNTEISSSNIQMDFKKGDVMVYTDQPGIRYLLETLEPIASDSFFNWNFFDTILQQKEGFSPYVWEDKAALLLSTNPRLHIKFNLKKSLDKDFSANWYAQLDWLYKQSENYESAHLQYPIFRLIE